MALSTTPQRTGYRHPIKVPLSYMLPSIWHSCPLYHHPTTTLPPPYYHFTTTLLPPTTMRTSSSIRSNRHNLMHRMHRLRSTDDNSLYRLRSNKHPSERTGYIILHTGYVNTFAVYRLGKQRTKRGVQAKRRKLLGPFR